MSHKTFVTIMVVAIFGFGTVMMAPKTEDQSNSCHMREVDLCLAPFAVFTQNSNPEAVTNNEINKQCKMLNEVEGCLSNFTTKCMSEQQESLFEMVTGGGLETIKQLCNKTSSDLRKNYLKHGNCINSQSKGHKTCLRNFQAALEKAADIEWQERLKLACCSFNKLTACTKDLIEPKCGKEAWELNQVFFRTSFSRMPSVVCSKYEHNGKACAALLPPAGTIPKGAKSHSVLSKLLSMYTNPN